MGSIAQEIAALRGTKPATMGGLFKIPSFNRLWRAMLVSSLGDWVGFVAVTDLARRLGTPLELADVPLQTPARPGLRPGFLEDYPNGGGSRAYLITVATGADTTTFFWSNTANPAAWDVPYPADVAALRADGVDLRNLVPASDPIPVRDHLAAALRAEGLDGVDAWLGFPNPDHLRQVVPLLRPRAFVPHHWDDFWAPMTEGLAAPFDGVAVRPVLEAAGVPLAPPVAYYQLMTPLSWNEPGSWRAGYLAGYGVARAYRGDAPIARLVAGAAGGFLGGFGLMGIGPAFFAGLGLITVAMRQSDVSVPPDLAAPATAAGHPFEAGFHAGFEDRVRKAQRRPALVGAALGAFTSVGFLLFVLFPDYT